MKKIGCLLILMTLFVSACNSTETTSSGNDESDNTEISNRELTMAHIHGEASPVYGSLEEFGAEVENKSNDKMQVETYGEATLGDETVLLELVKTGIIDIAKVNGGALESFSEEFSVFSLPYIFENETHFKNVMQSETVQDMYADLEDVGLRGLTHYEAGTRSFYTGDTPIEHPDDLNGLKIRVMNNSTSIETMELLGASPTPLPASEVYSGLQQGIIDGAESSHIALTDANHGEVAKTFSYDEHTRIPDFLIMSADTWNSFSEEEKQLVQEAARNSSASHDELWEELMVESKQESEEELGVEFYEDIDKEPFRERVEPLIEERRENEDIAEILDKFEELKE
ncbi:tripartite ATP-independent transporter DctP family solute receptor [Salibacterium salarium]|uniref:TRAP transporter substrate-binding protein n=1 Tax=Salibacterium salarium TaxID=284579 RepID=UPI00278B6478|nr:TRAP transporter substrate-binding protein [Salibacterium salarium]MDQ0300112.1 tripartite ATP-independent transporter DctP family solute receptor [Salibacterium salarium]